MSGFERGSGTHSNSGFEMNSIPMEMVLLASRGGFSHRLVNCDDFNVVTVVIRENEIAAII